MPNPKVLIIGGGLGGLTLAQSLRSQGVDFELFERDEGPHTRVQGWAVALTKIVPHLRRIVTQEAPALETTSVTAGQSATDTIGAWDAFTKQPVDLGIKWTPGQCIRVNRAKFRQYLLTGLAVQWGYRFMHYEVIEGGGVKAFFEDGSTAIGDILVGADGLRSQVRHTLYQPNPPVLNVVPAGVIVGEITLNGEHLERQTNLGRLFYLCVGPGVHFIVGLRSYSEDLTEGHYYWLYFFPEANPAQSWVQNATHEELLYFIRDELKGIHPDLREIVDLQKPEGVSQAFVMYDRVPEVCPAGPVTLIGDAAHPMTPLKGDGANNAMQDSVELGEKIGDAIKAGTSLADALRAYEEVMVPRATQAVLMSREVALKLARNQRPVA